MAIHLSRMAEFGRWHATSAAPALLDHHIAAGFFYPRWVPELMLGNGYPVFNYYAPATYYVAEALHLLGLGYYTALMMSFAIFVAVAGIGAYRLALDLFGRKQHDAAFVAGVAYMYAPYLLSNVFIRGAIAESVRRCSCRGSSGVCVG
ncbi:MAG: hypothetical protein R2873_28825 [Caldilineaceae bacterium]